MEHERKSDHESTIEYLETRLTIMYEKFDRMIDEFKNTPYNGVVMEKRNMSFNIQTKMDEIVSMEELIFVLKSLPEIKLKRDTQECDSIKEEEQTNDDRGPT